MLQQKLDKLDALRTYFGYDGFREGQEPLVDALLNGRDALGIMPTGAGKSVCYQVPGLVCEGVALVISPLISLMKDQVSALQQMGLPADFLNSSQSQQEQDMVLDALREGSLKILYVAPERLFAPGFPETAGSVDVALVAVDEAHCVSQWGQDFRSSYLRIREFIDLLPRRPVIGAFTATATGKVREDIVALLGLEAPEIVVTGFDRPNLSFSVQEPSDRYNALARFLRARADRSGIVYCLTRKDVEQVCERLRADGYSATRYHAGLSDNERRENQERFQQDDERVMVATNAFGMGIDKSNVAFVVHYGMPKNLESYYQEAGRAGRDGSPAECLLLYKGNDVRTNQFFIEKDGENDEMDAEARALFREAQRDRLRQMTFYCHTQECLRRYILRYFGQDAPVRCDNCGNCLIEGERVDVTVDAQKVLSCVKRMNERFGVAMVAKVLRGSGEERVMRLGLDKLSTYGIMRDASEKKVRAIIGFLTTQECLVQTDDEYPVLRLGPRARAVLFGGEQLFMNPIVEKEPAISKRAKVADVRHPRLYTKLQALRTKLAAAQSVPAYIVFPDATLREMCEYLPRDETELSRIGGVGAKKLERYGAAFLEEIRAFADGGDS